MKNNPQYGIIGFFDLLGYQSLLENNDDQFDVTNEVLDVLSNIESRSKDYLQKSGLYEGIIIASKKWDYLIFSDTILLSLTLNPKNDLQSKIVNLFYSLSFFASIFVLSKLLFDFGLPFRGALNYGKFIINKNCFAGKIIVDSYKLSNKLDVAAIVCNNEFVNFINSNISDIQKEVEGYNNPNMKEDFDGALETFIKEYNDLFSDYLIPFNDGSTRKLKTFNLFESLSEEIQKSKLNISNYVYEKFSSHNKDIPLVVETKINNTI